MIFHFRSRDQGDERPKRFNNRYNVKSRQLMIMNVSSNMTLGRDRFPPSRYPFADLMNDSQIPQFVTITFDDSINSQAVDLYTKYIFSLRGKRKCNRVRFTCFVSFDVSECDAIQFLKRTKVVEFGHHTSKHTRLSSRQDIQGAVDSLLACGVPQSSIGGFRAPYLDYNQTTFDSLYLNHVPYDSTIIPHDDANSQFGRQNQWPFTLESGFLESNVKCGNTGTCAEDKSYPGMWEIPMYRWYHMNNTFLDDAMDYRTFADDVQQNFERRYFGNRAPFGIYLHAPWLEEHGPALRKWIQMTLDQYDDVFFVTNMDLLQWMNNPVPKDLYIPPMCDDAEYYLSPTLAPSTLPSLSFLESALLENENTALAGFFQPMRWVIAAQIVSALLVVLCLLGRMRRTTMFVRSAIHISQE